jgi:hypothetical protein
MEDLSVFPGCLTSGMEIQTRNSADPIYVRTLMQSTSWEFNRAIPNPLKRGPKITPTLMVLCSKAFAAVKEDFSTINGMEANKAGANKEVATALQNTNMYKYSTVKASCETRQGINPMTSARMRSEPIRMNFFGNRSMKTPMKGPKMIGGRVCRIPMTVV